MMKYQISRKAFIDILLVPWGQAGEAWEPSKRSSAVPEILMYKDFIGML
jgi:hypothetical protein